MHGNSTKKPTRSGADETYIIKPENLCQGKGIFLCRDPMDVDPAEHCVAQRYITNPFLLEDLKFDLRIYVLLYGVNPLRIFIYEEGLVRLATEPYVEPTEDNIDNLFIHLTNYAINKNHDNFQQNSAEDSDEDNYDEGTHKRSLSSLYFTLNCMGKPCKKLKKDIEDIIIKTLICAQPSLSHLYKSCQPDDLENQLCF
jgi:tubulin polyglutamylase TTLL6/13